MTSLDTGIVLAQFNRSEPANETAIRTFENGAFIRLPDDYRLFLKQANGGEGLVGDAYLILWPIEQLRELNAAYQVGKYAPGLLLFGSDGGGEAFAFDTRSGHRVVSVPFVGMELDAARPMASTFNDFLQELFRS